MKTKKTTDLFRFVTLRSAKPVTEAVKFLKTVPFNLGGHFIAYAQEDSFNGNWEAAVAAYVPWKVLSEIQVNPDHEAYTDWLFDKQKTLTVKEVANGPRWESLPETTQEALWDAVFHSVITNTNLEKREVALRLIVAHNFDTRIKNYAPGQVPGEAQLSDQTVRSLAHAVPVLPRYFKPTVKPGSFVQQLSTRSASPADERIHAAALRVKDVEQFGAILKELRCYETRFNLSAVAAIESAQAAHAVTSKKIVATYLAAHPELEGKPDLENLIPDTLFEEANIKSSNPFDPAELATLSLEAQAYIKDKCMSHLSVTDVIAHLERDLTSAQKDASKVSKRQIRSVLINGVPTQVNPSSDIPFTISMTDSSVARKNTMTLVIGLGKTSGGISGPNFQLVVDGITKNETAPRIKALNNGFYLLELFVNDPFNTPLNPHFTLAGTFNTPAGKQYTLKQAGLVTNAVISGMVAELLNGGVNRTLQGITSIGKADYRRVEQEICCYVPGEVSHIENVMAKEYKERSTRNFVSTTSYSETSSSREVEDLNDTTTTTRNELSTEVAEVINRDRQSNVGFSAGVSGQYLGTINFSVGASGDFSFGQSTSQSNSRAQTYAEDVTRRALERIVQKTTVLRSSTIVKEFEENNKHGFDNRRGDKHVTGVYRWIDKVYNCRIVNYGLRSIYEFMVPEPAKFYKTAVINQLESADTNAGTTSGTTVAAPLSPAENGIKDASSILRTNYVAHGALYGLEFDPPADALKFISAGSNNAPGDTDSPKSFQINGWRAPESYVCFKVTGTLSFNYKARVGSGYINVTIAGASGANYPSLQGKSSLTCSVIVPVNQVETDIAVQINTKKCTSYNLSLQAHCSLKTEAFERWQQEIYGKIVGAYEQQMIDYNDALARAKAEAEAAKETAETSEEKTTNPLFNVEIVNTELKRACIELMMRQWNLTQGQDFYANGDCDVPYIRTDKDLNAYGLQIKFFEEVFDWNLMSQQFYGYYWAKRCDWKSYMTAGEHSDDNLFRSFLQSGMARVVVPVKEGYDGAVAYYMQTGKVWNGLGVSFEASEDMFLASLTDSFDGSSGTIEAEWQIIVPSTLNIIQARSAYLEDESLPCCDTEEVDGFEPNSNVLRSINESDDTEEEPEPEPAQ